MGEQVAAGFVQKQWVMPTWSGYGFAILHGEIETHDAGN